MEIDPGDYLVDGSLPIDEVVELIGFAPAEADECETAGGLVLALLDRIPEKGDSITVVDEDAGDNPKSAEFTVEEMDNLRVDKIRIRLEAKPSGDDAGEV